MTCVSSVQHRVVVTGLGAVSPIGNDVATFWQGLMSGRSGVAIATRYDPTDIPYVITAEVKDFDPARYTEPNGETHRPLRSIRPGCRRRRPYVIVGSPIMPISTAPV
jgi:3-oxoacyl-(acyl-carrier-protein) synthase